MSRVDPMGTSSLNNNVSGGPMSTNITVGRQTPDTSFGARVAAGAQTVGNLAASAAGTAAGMLTGNGIVSAAVSSLSTSSTGKGLGGLGAGAVPYATVGGPMTTTIGGGVPGGGGITAPPAGGGTGTGVGGISNGDQLSNYQGDLASFSQAQGEMLKLQMAMSRESNSFQTVSNCVKTRSEAEKSAIQNIR